VCSIYKAKAEKSTNLGAVVHVDGTARVQTLSAQHNPDFYRLVKAYGAQSSDPVVLNTSFNLKGQPIVETPRDALMTFYGCGLNDLVVGNFHLEKQI